MRITLVRPPTFVPNADIYPYNLECISMALRQDCHDISMVDAEVAAGRKLSAMLPGGPVNRVANNIFFKRKVAAQASAVEELVSDPGGAFWREIIDRIVDSVPGAVGISCYSASMSSTSIIVEHLKAALPGVPVILGGIHRMSGAYVTGMGRT